MLRWSATRSGASAARLSPSVTSTVIVSGKPRDLYRFASGRSIALTYVAAVVPASSTLYGTLTCMIAASACGVHALIVASADSFVGCGGFAEKPIRNVRAGSELFVCGPEVAFLHDASAARASGQMAREPVIPLPPERVTEGKLEWLSRASRRFKISRRPGD